MKYRYFLACTLILMGVPFLAFSSNLVDVYRDALHSDPVFKEAEATWASQRALTDIAWSALLPQLSGAATVTAQRIDTGSPTVPDIVTHDVERLYGLALTQSVINFGAWAEVRNANATVKQAAATFGVASQDFMIRVAEAYFNVLQASDELRFTFKEEAAVRLQLKEARERYEVGLVAITGVHESQAKYDSVRARRIQANNDLLDRFEDLRQLTGRQYAVLTGPSNRMRLVRPTPAGMGNWVHAAEHSNYKLRAAHYAMIAAKEWMHVQSAGHLPTLDVQGKYRLSRTSSGIGSSLGNANVSAIGLALNVPILEGGGVLAKTRQARYAYVAASHARENEHRTAINQTRQAYLGVVAGISQIKADMQAIVSARSALASTRSGYQVGTRTMTDILAAQSSLYAAEKEFSRAQYQYLLETLRLKQAAGTLNAADLVKMNRMMQRRVRFADVHVPKRYLKRLETALQRSHQHKPLRLVKKRVS